MLLRLFLDGDLYIEYNSIVSPVPSCNWCPVIIYCVCRLEAKLVCIAILNLCRSVCIPCVYSILALWNLYVCKSHILLSTQWIYRLSKYCICRKNLNSYLHMLCSRVYILIFRYKCCKESLCSNLSHRFICILPDEHSTCCLRQEYLANSVSVCSCDILRNCKYRILLSHIHWKLHCNSHTSVFQFLICSLCCIDLAPVIVCCVVWNKVCIVGLACSGLAYLLCSICPHVLSCCRCWKLHIRKGLAGICVARLSGSKWRYSLLHAGYDQCELSHCLILSSHRELDCLCLSTCSLRRSIYVSIVYHKSCRKCLSLCKGVWHISVVHRFIILDLYGCQII